MHIRHMREDEKDAWRPLWDAYCAFYEADVPDAVSEVTWARFFDADEALYIFGAYDEDDTLIGFTTYLFHRSTWSAAWSCYLEDLFVDPQVRGGGTGAALIEAVAEVAREKKCGRLYWHTNRDNDVARGLYDKLAELTGFVKYHKVVLGRGKRVG